MLYLSSLFNILSLILSSPIFLIASYLLSLSFLSTSVIAIYLQKTAWQDYLDNLLINRIMYYLLLFSVTVWHLTLSFQGILLHMPIGMLLYFSSILLGFVILRIIEKTISKAYLHIFMRTLPFSALLASLTFCSLTVIAD